MVRYDVHARSRTNEFYSLAEMGYLPGMTEREFLGRPEALGEELKRLRLEAQVDLEEIIAETKVSRRVFEAIESGQYARLPEKVFCKNFLRQYSEMIGEDAGAIISAFDLAWERFQLASGSFVALTVDEPPRRLSRWWVWLPFVLAVAVVLLLVFLSFRGSRGAEPLPPDPRRSAADRPAEKQARSVATPFAVESPSPVPSPSGESSQRVKATIQVGEGKECWIHFRDHEGVTGQDLLRDGESRDLDLPGPVLLTVGNADAALIKIRDREYRDLGRAGQVARFTLEPDQLTSVGGEIDGG